MQQKLSAFITKPNTHLVTTLCLQDKCNKKGLAQQRCSVSAAACGWIQCTNYIYKHLDKQIITPLCISKHCTNQWAALIYCRVRTVSFHLVAPCVASCTATEIFILVASQVVTHAQIKRYWTFTHCECTEQHWRKQVHLCQSSCFHFKCGTKAVFTNKLQRVFG